LIGAPNDIPGSGSASPFALYKVLQQVSRGDSSAGGFQGLRKVHDGTSSGDESTASRDGLMWGKVGTIAKPIIGTDAGRSTGALSDTAAPCKAGRHAIDDGLKLRARGKD
jgi:hypothetical protein